MFEEDQVLVAEGNALERCTHADILFASTLDVYIASSASFFRRKASVCHLHSVSLGLNSLILSIRYMSADAH